MSDKIPSLSTPPRARRTPQARLASVPHYVRIRRGHRAHGRGPSGGERVRQRARPGRTSVLHACREDVAAAFGRRVLRGFGRRPRIMEASNRGAHFGRSPRWVSTSSCRASSSATPTRTFPCCSGTSLRAQGDVSSGARAPTCSCRAASGRSMNSRSARAHADGQERTRAVHTHAWAVLGGLLQLDARAARRGEDDQPGGHGARPVIDQPEGVSRRSSSITNTAASRPRAAERESCSISRTRMRSGSDRLA